MENSTSGFSLVELLVVLAIMAILTLAAMPSYQHFVAKAHYFELVQVANQMRLTVEHCYQVHQKLSSCRSGYGGIPKQYAINDARLVKQATVLANGVIWVIPKAQYGLSESNDLRMTPVQSKHTLSWQYSGGGVEEGYIDL